MKLTVLGSGSRGNSYVLQNEDTALILEAGVPLKQVKEVLDFNVSKVAGVIGSHIHSDHLGRLKEFEKAGLRVHHPGNGLEHGKQVKFGEWKVKPLKVVHDVETLAFMISHPEIGSACYLCDTHYFPYKLPPMNHWLLEINFAQDILDRNVGNGRVNSALRDRIIQSHLELEVAKDILRANDLSQVKNIVLCHLSDSNSDAGRFKREITELTGKPVYIAEKGLTLELNKEGL